MSTSDLPEKSNATSDQSKPGLERLYLKSHKDLLSRKTEIFKRIRDNPELSRLIILNPVVAFEEMGIQVSSSIQHHILTTIQYSPKVRQRQEKLEKTLNEKLGKMPQPNNPEWVSQFLFTELKLEPLNTRGLKPTYRPLANEPMLNRLSRLRAPARKRYHYKPRILRGSAIKIKLWQPAIHKMDLNAPLPKIKTMKTVPKKITLEELYFYKDSHPLVHDLLELGIIQHTAFQVHSRSNIRKINEGKVDNALYRWIKTVRFPEEQRDEPDV